MILQESSSHHVILQTPAKVNLFLEVLRKREDGYHDINSLFVAISLFDTLEVKLLDSNEFRLTVDSPSPIPVSRDNLVAKSWELMKSTFRLSGGFEVQLTKRIPVSAGLGGGSSDASAMILACNLLFGLSLDRDTLAKLSAKIGSDCPFFFSTGCEEVTGRGEIMNTISIPSDFWLVLAKPPIEISTASAYASLGSGLTNSKPPFKLPYCRTVEDLAKALRLTGNDFEPVQFSAHNELIAIRDRFLENGALLARMSGSGPTMFGLFSKEPDESDFADFKRENWHLLTVRPVSLLGEQHTIGGNRGDNRSKGYLT